MIAALQTTHTRARRHHAWKEASSAMVPEEFSEYVVQYLLNDKSPPVNKTGEATRASVANSTTGAATATVKKETNVVDEMGVVSPI